MNEHHCLLCMGSNTNRFTQLSAARKVLSEAFPDIHFGELMETQAIGSGFHSPFSNQLARFTTTLSSESVHNLFKELERHSGRLPGDKAQGIVKLDIDLSYHWQLFFTLAITYLRLFKFRHVLNS